MAALPAWASALSVKSGFVTVVTNCGEDSRTVKTEVVGELTAGVGQRHASGNVTFLI